MIILIPSYEPDEKLVNLVRRLSHRTIVVVDDGSGQGYTHIFARVRALGAEVITYDRNYGKGYALKTGFAYVRTHYPEHDVVCADSDGQHRPEDIDAIADRLASTDAAMVLGARRFTGEVPARSRIGNTLTRMAFRLATGRGLIDTQTGLRGYPAHMLAWLGEIGGDRFEYELRLLLRAVREGLHIEEVEIATIYLEDNASSHFRPIRDSARIYRPLLAFAASSLLGFTIDAISLFALTTLTGNVVLSAVGARLISATINYGVNYSLVFGSLVFGSQRSRTPRKVSALRYATLALGILAANVVLLQWLTVAIGSLVAAKAITELTLFTASFLIQKQFVFARPAPVVQPAVQRVQRVPVSADPM